MNLILKRIEYREDGIFGILLDENRIDIAVTLEHAFDSGNGDGTYVPKIPIGSYVCQRGQHQLESMSKTFTTFQVMNVPNHTNILLHMGNYNRDSDGCILLGQEIIPIDNMTQMITNSVVTFNKFMLLQDSLNEFQLTIEG